jgi:hypothetical protein
MKSFSAIFDRYKIEVKKQCCDEDLYNFATCCTVNIDSERRCALVPSLSPPASDLLHPAHLSPPPRGHIAPGQTMRDSSSSNRGQQPQTTTYLTSTPSAAGRSTPPLRSVTSQLLDLYSEWVDSGRWTRLLYGANGRMKKLRFFCNVHRLWLSLSLLDLHWPSLDVQLVI